MFDWDEPDQVADSIWGEFPDNEDHIVPYPKGAEEKTLPTLEDYSRKQRNEEASTVLRLTEQTSGSKNDFLGCNQENNSNFITNEELSAAELDVELWPDFPSLSTAIGKEYNDAHNTDSMRTHLMPDISGATNLEKMRVQLDIPPEMLLNGKYDKESDNFLDCDWANIENFEDLDKMFSGNYSVFGHGMVGNAGEFPSASSIVIGNTSQSIPSHDMPLSSQPSGHGSNFYVDELSAGKEIREEKAADSTVQTGEQTDCKTQVISEDYGTHNLLSDKANSQMRPLMSHRKAEEKRKTKDLHNISAVWSCHTNENQQLPNSKMNAFTTTETFHFPLQRQVRAPEDIGQTDPANQFMFSGYGCASYPFPSIPLFQHAHTEGNKEKPVSVDDKILIDLSKHPNSFDKPPDTASRPLTMTPQEKIEKLRRLQQLHAMLAIQQQKQQFAHQSSASDSLVPQVYSPRIQTQEIMTTSAAVDDSENKLSSQEHNMLVDQELPQRSSTMIENPSLEETIYYQLQDALGMLDIRIRLSIRDSLFRLAQSAMERQSANDSSTNKRNRDKAELPTYDETNRLRRSSKFPDAETGTNPIDRTVAHLLFHRPSESYTRPVKEEVPQSPVVSDAAQNASLQARECTSEDYTQDVGEMEMQPQA